MGYVGQENSQLANLVDYENNYIKWVALSVGRYIE